MQLTHLLLNALGNQGTRPRASALTGLRSDGCPLVLLQALRVLEQKMQSLQELSNQRERQAHTLSDETARLEGINAELKTHLSSLVARVDEVQTDNQQALTELSTYRADGLKASVLNEQVLQQQQTISNMEHQLTTAHMELADMQRRRGEAESDHVRELTEENRHLHQIMASTRSELQALQLAASRHQGDSAVLESVRLQNTNLQVGAVHQSCFHAGTNPNPKPAAQHTYEPPGGGRASLKINVASKPCPKLLHAGASPDSDLKTAYPAYIRGTAAASGGKQPAETRQNANVSQMRIVQSGQKLSAQRYDTTCVISHFFGL